MQLSLPFPSAPEQSRRSALWVMACPDDDAALFARRLMRRRHVFVHSETGAAAISPDDFILLRASPSGAFLLLGPPGADPGALLQFSHDQVSQGAHGGVHSLVGFVIGEPGLASHQPARDSTALERLIATLRNEALASAPKARIARSLEFRDEIAQSGDQLLLALLDREAADGIRVLLDPSKASDDEKAWAWNVHLRSERAFWAAGLSGQASRIRTLFNAWCSPRQLNLPLDETPPARSQTEPGRAHYQFCRVVAHRFALVHPSRPVRPPKISEARSLLSDATITDRMLCRWLANLPSSHIRAWHRWLPGTQPGELKLHAGLDTDVAVLLGLAGRTGKKVGRYTLRAYGEDCEVHPASVERSVGEAVQLTVRAPHGQDFEIDLILATLSGARIPLRLKGNGADGRFLQDAARF